MAGLDGVTFFCNGEKLLGGFYKGEGIAKMPTAIIIHGLPGVEKHLDIAYALRDEGWNCLYFHFRGSWGSTGNFSLLHLEEDTKAALDWVVQQPCTDESRIVLIGTSTGSWPAFQLGAKDSRVAAILAISPVIIPSAFMFPEPMADDFASMLTGITGKEMIEQWQQLGPLDQAIKEFIPRPICIIAAGKDSIFPPAEYSLLLQEIQPVRFISNDNSDHSFSQSRKWLVQNAVDYLRDIFPS